MKIVILIGLALLVLLDYAACCMAHDADERAERMYRKWKERRKEQTMSRYDDRICGKCKWHVHEDIDDGWVCVNDRSEYCTDWTEYADSCNEFEERSK